MLIINRGCAIAIFFLKFFYLSILFFNHYTGDKTNVVIQQKNVDAFVRYCTDVPCKNHASNVVLITCIN